MHKVKMACVMDLRGQRSDVYPRIIIINFECIIIFCLMHYYHILYVISLNQAIKQVPICILP